MGLVFFSYLLIFFGYIFAKHESALVPPLTYSECASIGYLPGELDCATCSLIQKAIDTGRADTSGEEEAAACRACCSETIALKSSRKFETARLEVPRVSNMFGNMMMMQQQEQSPYSAAGPGAKEWIEKSKDLWEDAIEIEVLTPKTSDGSSGAVLVLLPEEGSDATPLRVPVGTWKYEQIDAFLKRKLLSVPKAFLQH